MQANGDVLWWEKVPERYPALGAEHLLVSGSERFTMAELVERFKDIRDFARAKQLSWEN